jgi:hypothetical protein
MQPHQREPEPAGLKRREIGRASDLFARDQRVGRQHQLAHQIAEPHHIGVVEERLAFGVARVAFGHVGDEPVPVRAQEPHQPAQRVQIGLHLLHRTDIELVDDLGDVVIAFVAARRAVVEGADVPRADHQRPGLPPAQIAGPQFGAQRQQPLGDPARLVGIVALEVVIERHAAPHLRPAGSA